MYKRYLEKSNQRTNRKLSKRRSLRRSKQVRAPFMITESTKQQPRSIGYIECALTQRSKELGYDNDEIRGMYPT